MTLANLIAALTDARVIGDASVAVRRVRNDSREVEPGDVYVAVRGLRADGHAFVAAAIERGAVAVVVDHEVEAGVSQVIVGDTTHALGVLVGKALGDPAKQLTLIGITGTNGKTTTTYVVESILRAAGARPGVIGTVEYRWRDDHDQLITKDAPFTTPTPAVLHETFEAMRAAGCTHVVMETSSAAIEMQRLAGLSFAVAAFSNLTQDHLDLHGTMEAYRDVKRLLFSRYLGGTAVVNIDDPEGDGMAAGAPGRVLRVSAAGEQADLRVMAQRSTVRGIAATIATPRGELEVEARPLIGQYNVANLALAVGIGEALGLPHEAIARGIATLPGVPGRVERVANAAELDIFVDYAHTPDALHNVLSALRPLTQGRLICVFGCGGDRDPTKRPKMGAEVAQLADLAVVTSDNPRTEDPAAIIDQILAAVPRPFAVDPDRARAIRAAIDEAVPGDVVVIAGKGHEDYQIVGTTKHHFDDREQAADAVLHRAQRPLGELAADLGATVTAPASAAAAQGRDRAAATSTRDAAATATRDAAATSTRDAAATSTRDAAVTTDAAATSTRDAAATATRDAAATATRDAAATTDAAAPATTDAAATIDAAATSTRDAAATTDAAAPAATPIHRVVIDSRIAAPGDLYVAIRGEAHDGHAFVGAAVAAGASAVMVEHAVEAGAPAIVVGDCRQAIGQLAHAHRRRWAGKLIAITGSAGKTTTKELTRAALALAGPTHAADGSLNNETGVPLTVLGLRAHHAYGVIEMGMRGAGQIEYLTRIAEPDVAVVVNAGTAHIELLGSTDAIAAAKAEIWLGLRPGGTIVRPADDDRLATHAKRHRPDARHLTFGEAGADVALVDYQPTEAGAQLALEVRGQRHALALGLVGRHAALDACAALAAALAAGAPVELALRGLAHARPPAMRGELVAVAGRTVIVDCYNANPASMAAALRALAERARGHKALAVLGDMLELGDHGPAAHTEIGQLARELDVGVLTLGPLARAISDAADGEHVDFPDEAASRALARTEPGDWILLKASRGMRLERVLVAIRQAL